MGVELASEHRGVWTRLQVLDMLGLFKAVLHVVMTPNHKIISVLLHNCNFAV